MSSWPSATSRLVNSSIRRLSRCESGTPRVWIPTSATFSRSGLASMISCAIRESVRSTSSPSSRTFSRSVCATLTRAGTVRKGQAASFATPFRPHGTGLKGFVIGRDLSASIGREPAARHYPPHVDQRMLERFADLAVTVGSNMQPGQILCIEAETGMEPIVRAVAESAYAGGARFVDPAYFDPYVKRARLQHAADDTLEFVPEWYGHRMTKLGDAHAARIVFVPRVSPGILNGVDPKRAGRDQLPDLKERFEPINKRLVNWSILPYPTPSWAELVFPDVEPDQALERLATELAHVCRL